MEGASRLDPTDIRARTALTEFHKHYAAINHGIQSGWSNDNLIGTDAKSYTADDKTCTATFGPWTLVQGSSDLNVSVHIPVLKGTIQSFLGDMDISGATILCQFRLQYFDGPMVNNVTHMEVKFDKQSTGTTVEGVRFPTNPGDLASNAAHDAFGTWVMTKALIGFDHMLLYEVDVVRPAKSEPVSAANSGMFDVTYAFRADVCNAKISTAWAKLKTAVVSYHKTEAGDSEYGGDTTYALDAVMGAWQIIQGGSNDLIRFRIPFQSGTIAARSLLGDDVTDLKGIGVDVEIRLGWVGPGDAGRTPALKVGAGSNVQLVFDLSPPAGAPPSDDAAKGVVTVVGVRDTRLKLSPSNNGFLKKYMSEVIVAHKENIAVVLAQIDIGINPKAPWLRPAKWRYYYQEKMETGTPHIISLLCVLCIFDGTKDIMKLEAAFDAGVPDPAHQVNMILSQKNFMKFGLLPEIHTSFGAQPTDFQFQDGTPDDPKPKITLKNQISLGSVRAGAIDYYPKLDTMTIFTAGDGIHYELTGSCNLTGLADSSISYDGKITATCNFENHNFHFKKPEVLEFNIEKHVPLAITIFTLGLSEAITNDIKGRVESSVRESMTSSVTASNISIIKWLDEDVVPLDGGLSGAAWIRANLAKP